jgi:DNA-binding NarL/FixJ family response regulator
MRLVIADRQAATRAALSMLLAPEEDVDIVGQAGDKQQLLSLVETTQPDVVLLDWELVGSAAVDLLAELRAMALPGKVIALSGRPEAKRAALEAGVDGFVSKGDPPARLLTALRGIQL